MYPNHRCTPPVVIQMGIPGWMETYCNDFRHCDCCRLCWNSFLDKYTDTHISDPFPLCSFRSIIIVAVVVVVIESKANERYDKQFGVVHTMEKIIAHLQNVCRKFGVLASYGTPGNLSTVFIMAAWYFCQRTLDTNAHTPSNRMEQWQKLSSQSSFSSSSSSTSLVTGVVDVASIKFQLTQKVSLSGNQQFTLAHSMPPSTVSSITIATS